MKEIPIPLVKANQLFIVVGTSLAIIFQNKWVLFAVFLVVVMPVLLGPKANLVFKTAYPLLRHQLPGADTEDIRLQRFNQRIAATFLGIGSTLLLINDYWLGYLFTGIVMIAAGAALAGYCIGCVFYFQWQQLRHKMGK